MRSVNLKVKHERKVSVTLTSSEMRQIVAEFIKHSPGWPDKVEPEFIYVGEQSFPESVTFIANIVEERDSAPQRVEIPKARPLGSTLEENGISGGAFAVEARNA